MYVHCKRKKKLFSRFNTRSFLYHKEKQKGREEAFIRYKDIFKIVFVLSVGCKDICCKK